MDLLKEELKKPISYQQFDLEVINEIMQSFSAANSLNDIFEILLLSVVEHGKIDVSALLIKTVNTRENFTLEVIKEDFNNLLKAEITLSDIAIAQLQNNTHVPFQTLLQSESPFTLDTLKSFNCQYLFPIINRNELIGLVSCHSRDIDQQLSKFDLDFLKMIIRLSGLAIQSVKNLESLKSSKLKLARKVFELESIGEISRTLTESLELDQVIHAFLLSIIGYLGAENGSFFLYDNNEKSFYYKSSIGHQQDFQDVIIQFSPTTFTILEMEDYFRKSDEMPAEFKEVFDYLKAEVCLPLAFSQNIIALSFFGEKAIGLPYKDAELRLASILVSQAISPLRNSQLYVQLIRNNAELKNKREELEEINLTLQQKSSELELANQKMSKEILERKVAEDQVKKLNDELELRVSRRTEELQTVNLEMQKTLEVLQNTQEELVQAEKMASLGNLVAGVAHEINTPLGISLTAASYLSDMTEKFQNDYPDLRLKRSDLEEYIKTCEESSQMVLTNLKRAAELVMSFKEVAADQSIENSRTINLKDYLNNIFLSLKPKLKDSGVTTNIYGDASVKFHTDPGALSRIITNLTMNSLIHAFPQGGEKGAISIDYTMDETKLCIVYSDNGKGIREDHLKKIFDPFFTTNRGKGGAGLGLHIIFNLITQKLRGTIKVESIPGEGTHFYIKLPLQPE